MDSDEREEEGNSRVFDFSSLFRLLKADIVVLPTTKNFKMSVASAGWRQTGRGRVKIEGKAVF